MLVRLQEDPETGEPFLPIPDAWLDALDWRVGDVTVWTQLPNGDWQFSNRTKSERDKAACISSGPSP